MFSYKVKADKKGFTFIEIIIAVAIISILAAVVIPSVYSYVETGRQKGRDNIARTIYLAAQKQITEIRLGNELESFVASWGVAKIPYGKVNWKGVDGAGNPKDIYYLSKPLESTLGGEDLVTKLLADKVLDEDVLSNSICIEFNGKTGIVLSVFYSDAVEDGESLGYTENEALAYVGGERPYTHKRERRQGYYGGEGINHGDMQASLGVNIYDGDKTPLKEGASTYENVLYGEILIPLTMSKGTGYTLQLVDSQNQLIENTVCRLYFNPKQQEMSLSSALIMNAYGSGNFVYRSFPKNAEEGEIYARYIWVLDLMKEDAYSFNKHSIGIAYQDMEPQMIKIAVMEASSTGNKIVSLTEAHSHYDSEAVIGEGKDYKINAPRHLNNVRYQPGGNFTQDEDIDMGFCKNLLPLTYRYKFDGKLEGETPFTGKYFAMKADDKSQYNTQHKIMNLKIKAPALPNVGLFGTVGSGMLGKGEIRGIFLEKAHISTSGSGSIGSIAGMLFGGRICQSGSLSNVVVHDAADVNAGGLVGLLIGVGANKGMVEQCYNAGYGTSAGDDSGEKYGKITVLGQDCITADIGGLVGKNAGGTIRNSYNNSRVQIEELTEKEHGTFGLNDRTESSYPQLHMKFGRANIGGVVGAITHAGSVVQNTYATNYVGKTRDLAGGIDLKSCYTGGIAGARMGNILSSFYLSNGETDEGALTKEKLSDKLESMGAQFSYGTGYEPWKEKNAANYPYPRLVVNAHGANWEDIQEPQPERNLSGIKYYEIYPGKNIKTGGSYGLWSPGEDQLDNSQKILQDGYILATEDIEINGGSTKIFVSDGPDGNNFVSKNIGIATSLFAIPEVKCIPLNMKDLEKAALGLNPLYVRISKGNSKKDAYFEGYVNPLYAKAIFDEYPSGDLVYSIRTPRQMDNIDQVGKTADGAYMTPLAGTFLQEVDIDFGGLNTAEGYQKVISPGEAAIGDNVEALRFPSAVVEGNFIGCYDGGENEPKSIRGFSSGVIKAKDGVAKGIFSENGGIIKNLRLQNTTIGGYDRVGGLVGENKEGGKVSGIGAADINIVGKTRVGGVAGLNLGEIENVQVRKSMITGDSAVGGIAGENGRTGFASKIDGADIIDTRLEGDHIIGGIVGENRGVIANVFASYGGKMPAFISGKGNIGGIAGRNSYAGYIGNAYVAAYLTGAPTVGSGSVNPWDNVFYLKGESFNTIAWQGQGRGITALQLAERAMRPPFNAMPWDGKPFQAGYPYPRLLNHIPPESWAAPEPN